MRTILYFILYQDNCIIETHGFDFHCTSNYEKIFRVCIRITKYERLTKMLRHNDFQRLRFTVITAYWFFFLLRCVVRLY